MVYKTVDLRDEISVGLVAEGFEERYGMAWS